MISDSIHLPYGGTVEYHRGFLKADEIESFFSRLRSELPWKKEELVMFGRLLILGREVVWCADDGLNYTYSGKQKTPQPWSPALLEIKQRLERQFDDSYNACLLNYYPDGTHGMSWHSDDEPSIVPNSTIASVSIGAERKFVFKSKQDSPDRYSFLLESGSLLLMKGQIQRYWLHALPKSKKITTPRINLTFRRMVVE